MTAASITRVGDKYTVTAFVSPGRTVGSDNKETAVLDLCLESMTGPGDGSIMVIVPKEWVEEAARPLLAREVKDAAQTWTVTNTPGKEWVISLRRKPGGTPAAGAWKLSLAVPIKKPAKDTVITGAKVALFGLDAAPLADIAAKAQAQAADPVVRLESNPADTVALAFGQPVTLSWTLQNIVPGTAKLKGSMLGAREIAAVPGQTQTVWALDRADYVLEAEIMVNGVQHRVSREVAIDIDRPQYGFRGLLRPSGVILPSGPMACFWMGVNLTRVRFDVRSSEQEHVTPTLGKHARKPDHPEPGLNRSFQVQFGPTAEGEKWTIAASYDTSDPKGLEVGKIVDLTVTAVKARAIATVPSPQSTVLGFVAGRFWGVVQDGRPKAVAGGTRTVEWVAVATDQGLELRFVWETNQQIVAECKWPLGKVRCLGVTGVGDPEDMRGLVAVVQEGAVLKVKELALPELTVTREATLPAAFAGAQRLHLVAIGTRVYVRGDGVARSYALGVTPDFIDEPWLARLAWPAWEVVAVPGAAGGCLFALNARTGALLRIDPRAVDSTPGSLMAPREAASVNHRLAKLDLLQRAQLGDAAYLLGKELRYNLSCEEGGSESVKVDGRHVWQEDPRCVDHGSALVVVGGALVARSSRPDPGRRNVRQDRAYDPRLDVWVRCGHLFPGALGAHFACTRSAPRFVKDAQGSTRPVSSEGSVYCRKEDGTLWRIQGELLELIGFAGMNVAPLAEPSAAGATRWRGHSLEAGAELKPDDYLLSRDGRHQLVYQPDGDLVLYRLGAGSTWKPRKPGSDLDKRGTWEPERTVLWQTSTAGNAGCVRLQAADGDLVVYRTATGTDPAWGAHDFGAIWGAEHDAFDVAASLQGVTRQHDHAVEYSGSRLVLEDDGRLEIRSRSGVLLWRAPRKIVRELAAGEWLFRADSLVSQDGTASFVNPRDWAMARLGTDGYLRVYGRRSATPIWSTEQCGGKSAVSLNPKIFVESGGEIAVRDGALTMWSSTWARGSSGSQLERGQWFESPGGEYRLVLQHDGNLVLFDKHIAEVWSTNSSGGRTLFVAPDGNVGGPGEWWAADHGGVKEGPYAGRCGGIVMTARGFQVVSTSPAVVWYDVTDDGGFPEQGKVRRRNSRRCRIYNVDQQGYMFAAGWWRFHKVKEFSGVFVAKGGGAALPDNTWVVSEVQAGRFVIFNDHHNEWLFASTWVLTVENTFIDDPYKDRRNIFATSGAFPWVYAVGGAGLGFFELEPSGADVTIRALGPDEYVYAADFQMVGDCCRVLSWIPKPEGYAERRAHCFWQLKDV
ncbi:hypothetical protein [Nannocystis sp.]|uniref:hypothetical protein n=1 Tax=Nannocystis sp. TaxID=1962667 RepID=UPI0025F2796B|nr:hypothetical protein [Nannocystis sp.]